MLKTLLLDTVNGTTGVVERDPTEEECGAIADGELEAFRFENGRFLRSADDGEFHEVPEGEMK